MPRQPRQPKPKGAPLPNHTEVIAPNATQGDTVVVALNRATGIIFSLPGGRRVTIHGNAEHLRGREEITIPVGAYGLTTITREDWEAIKATYAKSMPIFKNGLIFAAERKADAVDMADERAELRHGLEPVDPDGVQGVEQSDGKD